MATLKEQLSQPVYTADNVSEALMTYGAKSQKKKNPVYLLQVAVDFLVETAEGIMQGKAGGFLAYDPLSKHLWAVDEDYVRMHYESWTD